VTESGFRGVTPPTENENYPYRPCPANVVFPDGHRECLGYANEASRRRHPRYGFLLGRFPAERQVAKPVRFTQFLAKATITQQSARCRGIIGEFAKLAKVKARCDLRRKLGAADSGERAGRGRG
jgi:hypothetical protein